MNSGRAFGLARIKKFKSRRRSLSQSTTGFELANLSGRQDLNLRPHGPEPCALSRLSYAPRMHALTILATRQVLSIVSRLAARWRTGRFWRLFLRRAILFQRCLHGRHEGAPVALEAFEI